MEDFHGNKRHARHIYFKIKPEREHYALELYGYSGNAGDSLADHNGMEFSTNHMNTGYREAYGYCSFNFRGGWWYRYCLVSNLNGFYYHDDVSHFGNGIFWSHWRTSTYPLKFVEMKIR